MAVSLVASATPLQDKFTVLSLFFVPAIDPVRMTVLDEEAHHIHKVLRMSVGEEILLSDGKGAWARGKITSIAKSGVEVSVLESGVKHLEMPRLSVIQGLPKSDRVKETIELLTESGADRIFPWQATRSISKLQSDSLAKWQQSALAAAKQSRRFFIPEIESAYSLAHPIENFFAESIIVTCHESASLSLSEVFVDPLPAEIENIFIVIGPEGGLTEDEVLHFQSFGARTVRLGDPIFRSAHAGGAVLSAVQALLRRW